MTDNEDNINKLSEAGERAKEMLDPKTSIQKISALDVIDYSKHAQNHVEVKSKGGW